MSITKKLNPEEETMRFIILLMSVLLIAACETTSKDSSPVVHKGVDGWTTSGENIWNTINGYTYNKLPEAKSYLVSPAKYKNYRLELEFKPDAQVNSGVFVNCDTNTDIGSKFCFEANISDNHKKPEFRTGSIVRHAPPPADKKVTTIDKWNKMVMTASNGELVLEINDITTAKVKTDKHPEGYIGLQRFKNGRIIFRNVKITEL